MTDPENDPQEPEGTDGTQDPPEDPQEPEETFSAEYVAELRQEAAKHRTEAKRADDLETALREAVVSKVAGPILQDPTVLEWSDDFNDEHGLPNPDAIREAAEALAQASPHLSRVRGDALQGHRGSESDAGAVDLAALLRQGA